MAVQLVVPQVGESVTEVQIGTWLKAVGDYVDADEAVVEIESDKATVELPAPISGVITEVTLAEGETAEVGDIVGHMEAKDKAAAPTADSGDAPSESAPSVEADGDVRIMPAAQHLLDQHNLRAEDIAATGPGGRLLKEDVQRHLEKAQAAPSGDTEDAPAAPPAPVGPRAEERVPMTPMRKRIAQRLVEAQQIAALLTTFNEVDMSAVMAMRKRYNEEYVKRHGVKLGFMSFFVKASVEALREFPQINAYIEDTDIVYHNYYDVGIAVGGGKGLVVPILRNSERMTFADIEKTIGDFGVRAQANKIGIDELQGGTFTISNGGVFGSLLSTPIVNPPQSGILGLHAIQKRPVVVNDEIVIRPMMNLALTYDHRIVDGREAVTFLRRIKECIEDPARILVEI
jgi:2-oxoglutarate dehydrogenase E2 component (dihydrolipoamide succinyltransferase)